MNRQDSLSRLVHAFAGCGLIAASLPAWAQQQPEDSQTVVVTAQ